MWLVNLFQWAESTLEVAKKAALDHLNKQRKKQVSAFYGVEAKRAEEESNLYAKRQRALQTVAAEYNAQIKACRTKHGEKSAKVACKIDKVAVALKQLDGGK